MEDLQEALQNILSDPEQMARMTALAESLGLKPPEGPSPQPSPIGASEGDQASGPGPDLGRLMGMLAATGGGETRVLSALRPVLSAEGQGRVDRALRAAKLSRLAGSLLTQRGPEHV